MEGTSNLDLQEVMSGFGMSKPRPTLLFAFLVVGGFICQTEVAAHRVATSAASSSSQNDGSTRRRFLAPQDNEEELTTRAGGAAASAMQVDVEEGEHVSPEHDQEGVGPIFGPRPEQLGANLFDGARSGPGPGTSSARPVPVLRDHEGRGTLLADDIEIDDAHIMAPFADEVADAERFIRQSVDGGAGRDVDAAPEDDRGAVVLHGEEDIEDVGGEHQQAATAHDSDTEQAPHPDQDEAEANADSDSNETSEDENDALRPERRPKPSSCSRITSLAVKSCALFFGVVPPFFCLTTLRPHARVIEARTKAWNNFAATQEDKFETDAWYRNQRATRHLVDLPPTPFRVRGHEHDVWALIAWHQQKERVSPLPTPHNNVGEITFSLAGSGSEKLQLMLFRFADTVLKDDGIASLYVLRNTQLEMRSVLQSCIDITHVEYKRQNAANYPDEQIYQDTYNTALEKMQACGIAILNVIDAVGLRMLQSREEVVHAAGGGDGKIKSTSERRQELKSKKQLFTLLTLSLALSELDALEFPASPPKNQYVLSGAHGQTSWLEESFFGAPNPDRVKEQEEELERRRDIEALHDVEEQQETATAQQHAELPGTTDTDITKTKLTTSSKRKFKLPSRLERWTGSDMLVWLLRSNDLTMLHLYSALENLQHKFVEYFRYVRDEVSAVDPPRRSALSADGASGGDGDHDEYCRQQDHTEVDADGVVTVRTGVRNPIACRFSRFARSSGLFLTTTGGSSATDMLSSTWGSFALSWKNLNGAWQSMKEEARRELLQHTLGMGSRVASVRNLLQRRISEKAFLEDASTVSVDASSATATATSAGDGSSSSSRPANEDVLIKRPEVDENKLTQTHWTSGMKISPRNPDDLFAMELENEEQDDGPAPHYKKAFDLLRFTKNELQPRLNRFFRFSKHDQVVRNGEAKLTQEQKDHYFRRIRAALGGDEEKALRLYKTVEEWAEARNLSGKDELAALRKEGVYAKDLLFLNRILLANPDEWEAQFTCEATMDRWWAAGVEKSKSASSSRVEEDKEDTTEGELLDVVHKLERLYLLSPSSSAGTDITGRSAVGSSSTGRAPRGAPTSAQERRSADVAADDFDSEARRTQKEQEVPAVRVLSSLLEEDVEDATAHRPERKAALLVRNLLQKSTRSRPTGADAERQRIHLPGGGSQQIISDPSIATRTTLTTPSSSAGTFALNKKSTSDLQYEEMVRIGKDYVNANLNGHHNRWSEALRFAWLIQQGGAVIDVDLLRFLSWLEDLIRLINRDTKQKDGRVTDREKVFKVFEEFEEEQCQANLVELGKALASQAEKFLQDSSEDTDLLSSTCAAADAEFGDQPEQDPSAGAAASSSGQRSTRCERDAGTTTLEQDLLMISEEGQNPWLPLLDLAARARAAAMLGKTKTRVGVDLQHEDRKAQEKQKKGDLLRRGRDRDDGILKVARAPEPLQSNAKHEFLKRFVERLNSLNSEVISAIIGKGHEEVVFGAQKHTHAADHLLTQSKSFAALSGDEVSTSGTITSSWAHSPPKVVKEVILPLQLRLWTILRDALDNWESEFLQEEWKQFVNQVARPLLVSFAAQDQTARRFRLLEDAREVKVEESRRSSNGNNANAAAHEAEQQEQQSDEDSDNYTSLQQVTNYKTASVADFWLAPWATGADVGAAVAQMQ
ncbi:unnamed protein product [Amoebophrya sp. A120]|nr:unnamed protein product [Amoebophrya sp. A120]|eukprot:GSA120T00007789001.1